MTQRALTQLAAVLFEAGQTCAPWSWSRLCPLELVKAVLFWRWSKLCSWLLVKAVLLVAGQRWSKVCYLELVNGSGPSCAAALAERANMSVMCWYSAHVIAA
mmetsp:Transcript_10089/g.23541  ORF Transcript_10089/g.23541 Transcript_10089/m.23541 type:complete len:102 (-) Transcript_10089:1327-1632(-)